MKVIKRGPIKNPEGFLGEREGKRSRQSMRIVASPLLPWANGASATVESYRCVGRPLESDFGHGSERAKC